MKSDASIAAPMRDAKAEGQAMNSLARTPPFAGHDGPRSEARERLRQRYGLTKAETDVALEIIKGDGRTAAAARLSIAPATVRAHLSRIFEKTGVHRQAELVRLLIQSGQAVTGPAE